MAEELTTERPKPKTIPEFVRERLELRRAVFDIALDAPVPDEVVEEWAKERRVYPYVIRNIIAQIVNPTPPPATVSFHDDRPTLFNFVRAKLVSRGEPFDAIVSTAEIKMWAEERDVTEGTIRTTVSAVRRKERALSADPAESSAETAPAVVESVPEEAPATARAQAAPPEAVPVEFEVQEWETLYHEERKRREKLQQENAELLERIAEIQNHTLQDRAKLITRIQELEAEPEPIDPNGGALANTERLLDEAKALATDTLTTDERTVAHFCFNGWDNNSDDCWLERHPLRRAAILQLAADMSRAAAGVSAPAVRAPLPAATKLQEVPDCDCPLAKSILYGWDVRTDLAKLSPERQAGVFRLAADMAELVVERTGK